MKIVLQLVFAFGVLGFCQMRSTSLPSNVQTSWSPYYKINYFPPLQRGIRTNNIGHQEMHDILHAGPAYSLPHLLHRDAGRAPFKDVLIIGAGSGNDVAAALSFGAQHIDAVEIDPVIKNLGIRDHPNRPYDDKRVTLYNDDGRSFLKKSKKKYDLVIYALVDSLVLHSSYSSLRLESFLFTREAMQDIRARLKPNGVFAMYNFYRQGWVVTRLTKLGGQVFGGKPLVFSLPYRAEIRPQESQIGYYTFILCGNTKAIDKAFATSKDFWINRNPSFNRNINGYGVSTPTVAGTSQKDWLHIGPTTVHLSQTKLLPEDNWPFLYLKDKAIPALNIRGMVLIGILSLALLGLVSATGGQRESTLVAGDSLLKSFNWQMFFLGAGFMLLETKSVVHMALLFGSTWIVNSFVFAAVLLMILLSNLWVAKTKPKSLTLAYVLLLATLLIGLMIPMSSFLALPGAAKVLASCAVTFVPIFFAGIIFSTAFRDSSRPDRDFGCNVTGIILGGLCENFSLAVGFNGLLGIAALLYALSWLFKSRVPTMNLSTINKKQK